MTIDTGTIAYWVGFIGLGTGIGILLRYQSTKANDGRSQLLKHSVAVLAITSGIIHILLVQEHLKESLIFGVFFGISGAALIAYAFIVEFSSKRIVYHVGVAGVTILIGLYLFTRLIAVPFSPQGGVEAVSSLDIITKVAEAMMLFILFYIVRRRKVSHEQVTLR